MNFKDEDIDKKFESSIRKAKIRTEFLKIVPEIYKTELKQFGFSFVNTTMKISNYLKEFLEENGYQSLSIMTHAKISKRF